MYEENQRISSWLQTWSVWDHSEIIETLKAVPFPALLYFDSATPIPQYPKLHSHFNPNHYI